MGRRRYASIYDICVRAAERFGEREVMALRTDEGREHAWTAGDLLRRSELAAARFQEAGLRRGDRLLVWSPSTPEIAAVYFGCLRIGVIPVPLDLRMTPDVVGRIADRADTRWLLVGYGQDAPDAGAVGLGELRQLPLAQVAADGADDLPADWRERLAAERLPTTADLAMIMFTSGTTGHPKGVMVTHGMLVTMLEASRPSERIRFRQQPRLVSLMPLSHLFGLGELLGMLHLGGAILYLRSRNPRTMLAAMQEHGANGMAVAPQLLDIFWRAMLRAVDEQGGLAAFQERRLGTEGMTFHGRRRRFRRELAVFGGQLRFLASGGAFLPPTLQHDWESVGIHVTQGYGATETGPVASTTPLHHPLGKLGRPSPVADVVIADDGEILVKGPCVTPGYWRDAEATALAFDEEGRYRTGDIGRFDEDGNLVLLGRKRDIIVLGNGLNVYPEDLENALRTAGLGDSVVLETAPGRIEVVVLDLERLGYAAQGVAMPARTPDAEEAFRSRIADMIRRANAALTVHERIDAWRLWPEADFPRTLSMKIRRDPVRAWAIQPGAIPLPVREGLAVEA